MKFRYFLVFLLIVFSFAYFSLPIKKKTSNAEKAIVWSNLSKPSLKSPPLLTTSAPSLLIEKKKSQQVNKPHVLSSNYLENSSTATFSKKIGKVNSKDNNYESWDEEDDEAKGGVDFYDGEDDEFDPGFSDEFSDEFGQKSSNEVSQKRPGREIAKDSNPTSTNKTVSAVLGIPSISGGIGQSKASGNKGSKSFGQGKPIVEKDKGSNRKNRGKKTKPKPKKTPLPKTAYEVVSFNPGINGAPVDWPWINSSVEGPDFDQFHHLTEENDPERLENLRRTLLTLGLGGEITLKVRANGWIEDGNGDDFVIFSQTFTDRNIQLAKVGVAENYSEADDMYKWFTCDLNNPYRKDSYCAGILPTKEIGEGDNGFDLSALNIKKIKFIRIKDLSFPQVQDENAEQVTSNSFALDALKLNHAFKK